MSYDTVWPAFSGQVDRRVRFHRGSTRFVLLIGAIAVKIPRPTGWKLFLHGLLANLQEREFSRTFWPELCPVRFSLPGGWIVVMPRCIPMSDAEWREFEVEHFTERPDYSIPAEHKQDSFGWLNGRIVAVDYGT